MRTVIVFTQFKGYFIIRIFYITFHTGLRATGPKEKVTLKRYATATNLVLGTDIALKCKKKLNNNEVKNRLARRKKYCYIVN